MFLILSYLPYVLSEGVGLSGILAIFMASIFMRNYAFHSLSPIGQVTVESMIEMTCNVSENFVFAYMGLSVPMTLHTVQFELIGIATVALLVSRTVSVVFTSVIVNSCRKDKVPFSYQAIMSFSGLRGAVAFYLALNVNSEYKNLIITTTIGLIIVTIIGLGSTTTCLLKLMAKYFPDDGIFYNEDAEDMMMRREGRYSGLSESMYDKNFQDEIRNDVLSDGRSLGVITRLEKIDQNYGRKYLRKDGWEDFLDDKDGKYEFHESKPVPEAGKYYDNLSNYQMSIAKYLEDSNVNLPYQDRKSVRLSMMSERRGPSELDRSGYLHPQRKRLSSKADDYEARMNRNMSKRQDNVNNPYFKSTRREQMSIMSEPRLGMPRGLKGIEPKSDERNMDRRLNVPSDIRIGKLEDISSRGSRAESRGTKKSKNEVEDRKGIDQPKLRLQSFDEQPFHSREEKKVESSESRNNSNSPNRSRQRVTFKEPETANIKIEPLEEDGKIGSSKQSDIKKEDNTDEGAEEKKQE